MDGLMPLIAMPTETHSWSPSFVPSEQIQAMRLVRDMRGSYSDVGATLIKEIEEHLQENRGRYSEEEYVAGKVAYKAAKGSKGYQFLFFVDGGVAGEQAVKAFIPVDAATSVRAGFIAGWDAARLGF